jgi:hypothetical protein
MTASKLTSTSMATMRRCPRQFFYRYDMGLRRLRDTAPLRLGSAFHHGQELRRGLFADDLAAVIDLATAGYAEMPDWAEPDAWAVECETVRQLLAGHFWRYGDDNLEFVAVELPFDIPLVNPDSGAASRTFRLAGKIDAIVRLPDGRLAVLEYKTAGCDISPDSDYWPRLRYDGQISLYVLAARALGYDVAMVLYDVTRKPTIKPRQIPELDDDGCKIVLDAESNRVLNANGKPRQTASSKDGYVLQVRAEAPAEYGDRLLADIGERPDYYFQRREIPRLEDDLAEYRAELWQQADLIRESRRRSRWFRNVSRMTCDYCDFKELCLGGVRVCAESPPSGYEFIDNVHPELCTGATP